MDIDTSTGTTFFTHEIATVLHNKQKCYGIKTNKILHEVQLVHRLGSGGGGPPSWRENQGTKKSVTQRPIDCQNRLLYYKISFYCVFISKSSLLLYGNRGNRLFVESEEIVIVHLTGGIRHKKYTHIPRVTQFLSPRPNWPPPSRKRVCPLPRNQRGGGAHSPGGGGPSSDDWKESLALSLIYGIRNGVSSSDDKKATSSLQFFFHAPGCFLFMQT